MATLREKGVTWRYSQTWSLHVGGDAVPQSPGQQRPLIPVLPKSQAGNRSILSLTPHHDSPPHVKAPCSLRLVPPGYSTTLYTSYVSHPPFFQSLTKIIEGFGTGMQPPSLPRACPGSFSSHRNAPSNTLDAQFLSLIHGDLLPLSTPASHNIFGHTLGFVITSNWPTSTTLKSEIQPSPFFLFCNFLL